MFQTVRRALFLIGSRRQNSSGEFAWLQGDKWIHLHRSNVLSIHDYNSYQFLARLTREGAERVKKQGGVLYVPTQYNAYYWTPEEGWVSS